MGKYKTDKTIPKIRIYEYKDSIRIKNSECIMLATPNTEHTFDISNSKILDKERNLAKILILEIMAILSNKSKLKPVWAVF